MMLFVSLLSVIRLISSTFAFTVWVPSTAVQVAPVEPPLAVSVTDAPGASEPVWVSDQTPGPAAPSSNVKSTPCVIPSGVDVLPWFLIVAFIVTAFPLAGLAGSQEMSVIMRSGLSVGAEGGVT